MNYYQILGVEINSTSEDIKKAFRRKSLQEHPDKNRGNNGNNDNNDNNNKFKLLHEAYETLSAKDKRKQYDRVIQVNNIPVNTDSMNNSMNNSINNNISSNNSIVQSNIHDLAHKQNNYSFTPETIDIHIRITLEQSYEGANIPVFINRKIIVVEGNIQKETAEQETYYVDIYQGIDTNEIITIPNKGHTYNNYIKGDVKLFINIYNNTIFKRDGLDLKYTHDITLKESLCGFTFVLTHLNGTQYKFDNHYITTPTTTKKLTKLGMNRGTSVGDLIIDFNIQFPTEISPDTHAVLEELDF